jgi:hypothetical protein
MGTSPFSPRDVRAAAGAHHELGPEYSDAVVASFLDKVDQQIAARVNEHLAASAPQGRSMESVNRRMLLKGFALGVAASIGVVLLVAGAKPGHHALVLLPVLAVLCGAGALWAKQYRAYRRAVPRQGPNAAGGEHGRLI